MAKETIYPSRAAVLASPATTAVPYQFILSGDDHLRLTTWSSLAGRVVILVGRFLQADGTIAALKMTHVPGSDRLARSQTFPMGAGTLINAALFVDLPTTAGQIFARLEVVRGVQGSQLALGTLLQGYVSDTQTLGWPGSPLTLATDGPGLLRTITGTDVAAGLFFVEGVPTGARWNLIAFNVALLTGPAVPLRNISLQVNDLGQIAFRSPSPMLQGAGVLYLHQWMQGVPHATVFHNDTVCAGLPAARGIRQGAFIVASVNNWTAADDFFAPVYLVEEWLEP